MLHLRIVTPTEKAVPALEVLEGSPSVCNVVHLPGAARRPAGDVILADVAREDASVILDDLKELGIPKEGAISVAPIDTQLSEQAERATRHARGAAADAVVWEEVEAHTSENVELSGVFLAFMVLAGLLAAVGIYQNSPILIVGAMVVGPEFGPLAGLCVALVQRRGKLAVRSAIALLVGFPLAIAVVYVTVHTFKVTGLFPDAFSDADHNLASVISRPDFFAFFVAACAGAAGMLSLSTAKSGALIGVLISVTTIPAAANVGFAAAYTNWDDMRGSAEQLGINLGAIVVSGTVVLTLQRQLFLHRRRQHHRDATNPATTRSRASS